MAHPHPLEIRWRGEGVSRVMLGAVQLGMPYGIANANGQPDLRTAISIVETAWENGIRHFDTGQSYGNSEEVLGQALRELGVQQEARIESKLAVSMDPTDLAQVAESIDCTLDRLGVERLWCMMLHYPAWLDYWDQGLGELLLEQRNAGRIQHLGVSLTYVEDADRCLAHPHMEVLQVPCNAWDRRLIRLGLFDTARDNGQLCCVRSIYLKGLLALPPETVAERLPIAREAAVRWHGLARRHGMRPVEMAVRFALTLETPLIVGAETGEQVRQTVQLASQKPLAQEVVDEVSEVLQPVLNDIILTPRRWEELEDAIYNPSEQLRR